MIFRTAIRTCAVILFCLLAFASASAQPQDSSSLKSGVVRIVNTKSNDIGTGFIVKIVKDRIFIVTAAHVVKGNEHPKVYLYRQLDPLEATLMDREEDDLKGLALLNVKANADLFSNLTALTIGYTSKIEGGESVKVIGFPGGTSIWSVDNGNIKRLEGRNLVLSGSIREGNSGGPVILNGQAIGLVTDVSQTDTYAARAEEVVPYLNGIVPNLVEMTNAESTVPATISSGPGPVRSSQRYRVNKKVVLGGEGGWDYLSIDSRARRLYISRSTYVMVVDADNGVLIGDIPNTNGVHGIAIAPDMDKGFTSNGRDGTVTIFDVKTLKVLGIVPAGKNPDAIIYDPVSKRVFAFNGASNDATAIDAKTGAVAGAIALGGKPEFAVADEKGHVFVNIENTSEIVQFDTDKLVVESRWKIAPGEEPSGLAMDRKNRRLFSVCSNKLMVVVNANDGRVVTTVPIGAGADAAAFDPETGFAFSSNGEGTLTVVHEDSPDKFSVFENVATLSRARTMALDTKTHQVYTVTAEYGQAPAPTAEQPRPRAPMLPGSFTLLILSR